MSCTCIWLNVAMLLVYLIGYYLAFMICRSIAKAINDGYIIMLVYIVIGILSLGSWLFILLYVILNILIRLNLIDPDKKYP